MAEGMDSLLEKKDEDDAATNSKIVDLLKIKVKLDNGEEGYVFTKNTDENPRGRFRCHVCNVPICSSKSLEEHASGKNHNRKMKTSFHSHETFSKIVIKETSRLCTDIGGKVVTAPGVDIPDLAPGEPVPPGFEDIVTRVPEITSTLEEMKSPLIGLEYLAEITPVGDEVEPKYCCLLCNKRGDPRTVLAHLVCFNHRIKYIGRYFPRTNTALALIPKVKEHKRGTGEVLAKIVKAIESKFGRLNPVIVDGSVFDEKKEEYYKEMSAGRHFYETVDSNYELFVDLDFIKKCAPEADNILTIDLEMEEAKKKSTAMKNEMNFKHKHKLVLEQNKKLSDRPFFATAPKRRREKSVETISTLSSKSRSRSRSKSYSRSRSWSRSRSRSHSKSHSRSHSRYRYMYRDYKRDEGRRRSPRYHRRSRSRSRSRGPSYRRYRPAPYRPRSPIQVRPSFRTIRYDSLYNDEDDYPVSERPKSTQRKVAELRDKRKKWDLYRAFVAKLEKDMAKTLKSYEKNPEKHPLYPEEWKKFWNRRYKELTADGKDASKHDFKPEWIKFWTVRMKELHGEELKTKKDNYRSELGLPETEGPGIVDTDVIEVSPTPLEDDKSSVTVDDIKNTWKALTGSEIKGVKAKSPEKVDDYELGAVKLDPDQPVRVITVLRLLTALESQLGSLGPRVNNLLSQAIALEKKKENSSDSLIEASENNVLFETVKEKLKGQLFAGIVEKHMVNATRVAIQNVAELFNAWKARKENPELLLPPVVVASSDALVAASVAPQVTAEPLIVPGIGAVDKVAIAQQIASALIAQGKTNVTEQELEQLINAVVGMAQAQQQPQPQLQPLSQTQLHVQLQPQPQPQPQALAPPVSLPQPVPPPRITPAVPSLVKDLGAKPKQTPLQQLVSSVSNSSFMTASSSLKLLQAYDDPPNAKSRKSITSKEMADLTEEDMKTLLQNFKDLSSDEQQCLITYLKELESKDPEGVEKLRKFVNLTNDGSSKTEPARPKEDSQGRLSPFSMREGGANPFIDDRSKVHLDEDEDDYSYEDIYKAAEKKIAGRSIVEQMIEEQRKTNTTSKVTDTFPTQPPAKPSTTASDDPECMLSEAKMMIANIMGQLPTKRTNSGVSKRSPAPEQRQTESQPQQQQQQQHQHQAAPALSLQQMFDNATAVPPPKQQDSSNLLNDYNYQDDLFGYSNEAYQNYPANMNNYHVESNSNEGYRQPEYPKNPDPSYNNYSESWNDNYAQFPPPQQHGGYDHQNMAPVNPQVFNRPPGGFQQPMPNEFDRPNDFNRPAHDFNRGPPNDYNRPPTNDFNRPDLNDYNRPGANDFNRPDMNDYSRPAPTYNNYRNYY